jgi:hypothetical protein
MGSAFRLSMMPDVRATSGDIGCYSLGCKDINPIAEIVLPMPFLPVRDWVPRFHTLDGTKIRCLRWNRGGADESVKDEVLQHRSVRRPAIYGLARATGGYH